MTKKLTKLQMLMKFYEDNPGEELTIQDIIVKMNCSKSAAYGLVFRASKLMHIESIHIVRLTSEGRKALEAAA